MKRNRTYTPHGSSPSGGVCGGIGSLPLGGRLEGAAFHTDPDGQLYTYRTVFDEYTEAYGFVKCTYVQLFDEQGRKVFSLQRADMPADTPVCRAAYAEHDMGELVPATLTPEALAVLAPRGITGDRCYVKPNALAWAGAAGCERQPTPPKASVAPWIVAAAAFLS